MSSLRVNAEERFVASQTNTALDEGYAAIDSEVIPGQYVMVAVSDTGRGMSKETLTRVFEPFFTTKEVGKGTGLGLSMVYWFVKQSGGHVTIYSEVGQGTTVKLYFRRFMSESAAQIAESIEDVPMASRDEVVLVVEDNVDVRTYSVMVLGELGYRVLEAGDAQAPWQLWRVRYASIYCLPTRCYRENPATYLLMQRANTAPGCAYFIQRDIPATRLCITAGSIPAYNSSASRLRLMSLPSGYETYWMQLDKFQSYSSLNS